MFIIYNLLTIIFTPIIYTIIFVRKFYGKEDSKRYVERFGYASIKRPRGKLLWIHAASVGESLSIISF